jgi:DNA invertase Pin-like site-specific DNA recombinase
MSKATKAVGYIRFSSDEQKDGNSVERQDANIKSYASRTGLEVVETLIDQGKSASKGHHIADDAKLGKFLKEADKGTYRGFALIVERQDRLSRLGITKTGDILKRLIAAGMTVHITEENRIIHDLVTAITSALSSYGDQQYSKKLSERIGNAWKAKKTAAAKGELYKGKRYTSQVPFWLEIVDGKIVEVTEYKGEGQQRKIPADMVREMFRLATMGVGSANICNQLNGRLHGMSRTWVVNTLRNRATLGEYEVGGQTIQGYFPRIIDQEIFDAARQQMESRRKNAGYLRGRKSERADNVLEGLVFDTGYRSDNVSVGMNFQRVKSKWTGRECRYLMSAFKAGRKSNRINYSVVEAMILRHLTQEDWKAVAGEAESAEVKAAKAELEIVLRELDKVTRRIETTTAAMEGDDVDVATLKVLAARLAKDEAALATLAERRDALQSNVDAAIAACAALYAPETLLELIKQGTPEGAEIRMRLKSEIRKRVKMVMLSFSQELVGYSILYVNGTMRTGATDRSGRRDDVATFEKPGNQYVITERQYAQSVVS